MGTEIICSQAHLSDFTIKTDQLSSRNWEKIKTLRKEKVKL